MSDAQFRRPARLEQAEAEEIPNPGDSALRDELADLTARAVMHQDRAAEYPAEAARLLQLLATEGLDSAAALWAESPSGTLPARLWSIYEPLASAGNAPDAAELKALADKAVDDRP